MLETLDYKLVLAGIAALISICNLIYYISTVLKGKTKPHMYTWLIWGLITVIAGIIAILNDGEWGAYYTILVAFNCFVIATLAYFKGVKDITQSDKVCLVICLIAIVFWQLTSVALISLLIVTFIDLAGFYPTIRKSFNNPHEENLFSFSLYALTYSLSIIALSQYSLLTAFYPVAIAISSSWTALFLMVRRYQLGYKIIA